MGTFWNENGGGIISGGLGLIGNVAGAAIQGAYNNQMLEKQHKLGLEANEHAAALNYEYGEKAADNAAGRSKELAAYNQKLGLDATQELWEKYNSPAAKKKAIEKAGLSIGLMYGGAGGSTIGTSAASGAAPQGSGASGQAGKMPSVNTALGLELGNIAADIALKTAQARKTNAEAQTEQGENKRGQLELQNYAQDIENKKAQQNLTEAQTRQQEAMIIAQNLANAKSQETFWDEIDEIKYRNKKTYQEIRAFCNQNDITEATKQAQIDTFFANLEKTNAEILLNNAQLNLTKQQADVAAATFNKILQEILESKSRESKNYFDMQISEKQLEWAKAEFNKKMEVQIAEGNQERRAKQGNSMWSILYSAIYWPSSYDLSYQKAD